jgi:excisionase family DNA binding protein
VTSFTDYATPEQAADRLGIHPETVHRLIRQGDIPATKVWGQYLIYRPDLERFAAGYDPNYKAPAAQRRHMRRVALRAAIERITNQ